MGNSPYKIGYDMGQQAYKEWQGLKDTRFLVSSQDAQIAAKQIAYLPDDCELWNDTMVNDYSDGFIQGFVDAYLYENEDEYNEIS